jgi:hypothetical protein
MKPTEKEIILTPKKQSLEHDEIKCDIDDDYSYHEGMSTQKINNSRKAANMSKLEVSVR